MQTELASTSCLWPQGKINLQIFSLKVFPPTSKMPIVLLPHPPSRSCQELHLFPGVTYIVHYWGQGVASSENGEAVE